MSKSTRIVDLFLLSLSALFGMVTVWFLLKWLQNLRVPFVAIIITALIAIALFAGLWLPKKIRPQIIMMTLSTLFTMYIFEGFLSWFGNPLDYDNERFVAALFDGFQVIDRTLEIDMYIDMKEAGEAVTIALPAAGMLEGNRQADNLPRGEDGRTLFPLSNESNKKAIYCNEGGERIIYETDEHGFHNPPGIWANGIDIAIIGDSFANGACVESETNAVARIREKHPRTVTVGSSGSGPMLELAVLREYVAPFTPETVVWWYFEGNDLLEIQTEKNDPFIAQYLNRDFTQNLLERQDEVDAIRQQYIEVQEETRREELITTELDPDEPITMRRFLTLYQLRRLLGIDFVPNDAVSSTPRPERIRTKVAPQEEDEAAKKEKAAKAHYNRTIEELPENLSLLKDTLVEARDTVHEWGGEFIIVYIPQWERYGNEDVEDWMFQRKEVMPLLEELEVPIIDFKQTQDAHPDPLSLYPYRINGHYNADGYQLLADAILDYLE